MTTTGLTLRRFSGGTTGSTGSPGGSPAGRATGPAGGPATVAYVLVSAVLRGFVAALAGLFLVCGLALLDWAVTPTTGSNAGALLRGGAVVFAAGHFLPVSVAESALTLRPLAVTVIAVLVIASSASRGRLVRGRTMEAVHGLVLALAYAAAVEGLVRYLAPADNARLGPAPLWIAGIGVVLGLATHRTAWNRWWRRSAPGFLRAGVRAGSAAVCLLLAAGAIALALGLAASFHDAVAVSGLTAPGFGDGFGLALLSLAFLPNAAVAGVGYVTGAGFTIGAGSYSPFGSVPTELPAIPLLTAVPDGASAGRLGLAMLAVPVLIGVLVAWQIDRRLDLRWQRMAAAGVATALAALAVTGLAAAARGGVAGGPWAAIGVPPLLIGAAVAGTLGVVSVAWTGVAGLRTVPWRAARAVVAAADRSDDSAACPSASRPTGAGGVGDASAADAAPVPGSYDITDLGGVADPAAEDEVADAAVDDGQDSDIGDDDGKADAPAPVPAEDGAADDAADAGTADDETADDETADDLGYVDEADGADEADASAAGEADLARVDGPGLDDASAPADPIPDTAQGFPGAASSEDGPDDADADSPDEAQRAG